MCSLCYDAHRWYREQHKTYKEGKAMKDNRATTVNGWDIMIDPADGTFFVWLDSRDFVKNKLNAKVWKTLKGAERWCESH